MPIAAPVRKGLVARRIAAERPELSPNEIARLAGTGASNVKKALARSTVGKDKPKSVAPWATNTA